VFFKFDEAQNAALEFVYKQKDETRRCDRIFHTALNHQGLKAFKAQAYSKYYS
jgi:hypothetical protein